MRDARLASQRETQNAWRRLLALYTTEFPWVRILFCLRVPSPQLNGISRSQHASDLLGKICRFGTFVLIRHQSVFGLYVWILKCQILKIIFTIDKYSDMTNPNSIWMGLVPPTWWALFCVKLLPRWSFWLLVHNCFCTTAFTVPCGTGAFQPVYSVS